MRNCDKCLNNVWDFKKNDDTIEATCKMCGHEVFFPAKKTKTSNNKSIITDKFWSK